MSEVKLGNALGESDPVFARAREMAAQSRPLFPLSPIPKTFAKSCAECDHEDLILHSFGEHDCFQCSQMTFRWVCRDCGIRKRTGCQHVEAQPPAEPMTKEQVRERLREIFEGAPA